ncbi:MAG: ATP-dependent DNA helicase [Candidatus Thorarchaeota archaeon]|nr:ATP-dependent DNA helicase [Candidatus Thorarchaeota archaeon]
MNAADTDPLVYFPYEPRPYQEKAVHFAAEVFASKTVGLLSADCGVGKTVAVLAGYLSARLHDESARLIVLTRTHSQSRVFESELEVLRGMIPTLTATTMLSRVHVCPMRSKMDSLSSTGFMRACAAMIRTNQCTYYHNFYRRNTSDGRYAIRESVRSGVEDLLESGVVNRERIEDMAYGEGLCPYEIMRWCARSSRIIIGPYNYIFRTRVRDAMLGSIGTSIFDVDILIDEAHNLSGHVLDAETAKMTGEDMKWLREHREEIVKETKVKWIGEAVDFLYHTISENLDGIGSLTEKTLPKWNVAPRFVNEEDLRLIYEINHPGIGDPESEVVSETPLDRLIEFLFVAQMAATSDGWHVTLNVTKPWGASLTIADSTLMIRPLNSAGLTAPVLRAARSALLMSGTIRPLAHYARLLGVGGAKTEDLASPYPRGTRLVLIDKTLSTKYRNRNPNLWREISSRINVVLSSVPANKSALIAFPSYKMMHEVLSHGIETGFRGRVVESKSDRIETVVETLEAGPHAIFCVYGGKFAEGIDLVKGGSSLIDLIIGIGIPFSPPTSYQYALQEWYDSQFGENMGYYYSAVVPSIRQVAQLLGRLRRSPEDWGVVVLLDSRFLRYIDVLGDDVVSDTWPYSDVDELHSAVQQYIQIMEGNSHEMVRAP